MYMQFNIHAHKEPLTCHILNINKITPDTHTLCISIGGQETVTVLVSSLQQLQDFGQAILTEVARLRPATCPDIC